jgi:hypothetical protein
MNGTVSREGAPGTVELREPSKSVLRNAVRWLAKYSDNMTSVSDLSARLLIIFGVSYGLRPLATSERPAGVSEEIRRLSERVASEWALHAEEFHDKFVSGGFISLMLAAAASQASDQVTGQLIEICRNEWRTAESSNTFAASPTLLWTGRRLLANMGGDSPGLLSRTWWSSDVSKLIPKYTVSTSVIQQMVADVAAMSAYGQFLPPMPDPEREYLRDTLSFLTFYYLKEQDLDMVNPLLRALRYTGMTDIPEYRHAIEFVLGRSHVDGLFSMRDMATHLQSLNDQSNVNVQRSIHLPLTVAGIWTLVDCVFPESAFGSEYQ